MAVQHKDNQPKSMEGSTEVAFVPAGCTSAWRDLVLHGAIWFCTARPGFARLDEMGDKTVELKLCVVSMYPMYGRCRMVVLHRPGLVDT